MSDIGITVSIESQADVAAIEKATASTGEMTQKTDDLDKSLARLKETLAKADAGLKEIGESGEQAGTKMAAGAAMTAQGALKSIESILPVSNVNDLVQGAWKIGSEIGAKLGEAVALANRDALDWDHLFGDGDELDATALQRKKALESVRQAHADLMEQLGKPPDDALDRYLSKLSEQAREADLALGELQKLTGTIRKAEDATAAEDAAAAKDEIDKSNMSDADKLRAKAEAENTAAELARVTRDERRQEEVEMAQRQTDAKAQAAQAAAGAQTEAEIRQAAATGITGSDQYQRAKAGGADDKYLKDMFDRRARDAGFDDLNESDLPKPGQSDSSNVIKARSAANKAAQEARDAAAREQGLIARTEIESASDQTSTDNAARRRTEAAEKQAGRSEQGEASKEAAEAGKAAKEAAKDGDKGTKELADGLKQMAAMVKDKDKAMQAALLKMAEDLKDGASTQEIAAIQRAMQATAQSSNKAFADLARAQETTLKGVEESARIAQEAMRKAEQALAKVNSMK